MCSSLQTKKFLNFLRLLIFSAVIGNLIFIFLNNVKANTKRVIPNFRFILLKISKGKIMGLKYFVCNSPRNFCIKIKAFFASFFYLLTYFRNTATKIILLTCSRPVHIQQSILELEWSFLRQFTKMILV